MCTVELTEETFADRLRKARERNGWTQAQVAEWCDVNTAALSHWESGRREPNLENLVRLCNGLRVSANWLLGLEITDAG